jgi:hypothetical protein
MGLFRSRKEAPREEVIDWCTRQYTMRAESLEAQELILMADRAGWTPQDAMWKFLETQWPTVVIEARQRFKGVAVDGLLKDVPAMEAAIRRAAPKMYPLTSDDHVEGVVNDLRQIGAEEGWRL